MSIKRFLMPSWCKLALIIVLGLLAGKDVWYSLALQQYPYRGLFYEPSAQTVLLSFPREITYRMAWPAMLNSCEAKVKEANNKSAAQGFPAFASECGFGGITFDNMPIVYKIAATLALLLYWYLISVILCTVVSPIDQRIKKLNPSTQKIVYDIIIGLVLATILYLVINQIYAAA